MRNLTGSGKKRNHLTPALAVIALAALLTAALSTAGWSVNRRVYYIEPEYERKLERVVLSLPTGMKGLSYHRSIMESLPDYTEILMLLPQNKVDVISRDMAGLDQRGRIRLIPFGSRRLKDTSAYVLSSREQILKSVRKDLSLPSGSIWAQDLFEVVRDEAGMTSILTPSIHKWFVKTGKTWEPDVLSDNEYVSKLLPLDFQTEKMPLTFKGGNVLIDNYMGRRIAFCGGDIIRDTILVSERTLGMTVTPDEVVEQLRHYLRVDDVVVVGEGNQPRRMFHLDQAMVLFPHGVAGVTRIVGNEEDLYNSEVYMVNELLTELRAKLTELGYRIVDIDATVDDVLNYRYYVNGVPYINKKANRREFLIPHFNSSGEKGNREVYERNVSAIEALGYRVIPVHTHANKRHGGIHCMVNVIS